MIGSFLKPSVNVEAVQFDASQENVLEIFHWLGGCFYVPRGADGEHRTLEEYTDEGLVEPEAPPFLIIKVRNGEDRVDINAWIVKYDDVRISVYSDLDFSFNFIKKETT